MDIEIPIRAKITGTGIVGKTYACQRCGAKVFLPRPAAGVEAYPATALCAQHKEN